MHAVIVPDSNNCCLLIQRGGKIAKSKADLIAAYMIARRKMCDGTLAIYFNELDWKTVIRMLGGNHGCH